MKIEQIECSETSAYIIQTPGNYSKENIICSEHGESLKSRISRIASSVLMEQLGSHWTYFYEIWYLHIFFRKTVENVQVLLKSDNNDGYFTWRPIHNYDNISLNSPYNKNCLTQNL